MMKRWVKTTMWVAAAALVFAGLTTSASWARQGGGCGKARGFNAQRSGGGHGAMHGKGGGGQGWMMGGGGGCGGGQQMLAGPQRGQMQGRGGQGDGGPGKMMGRGGQGRMQGQSGCDSQANFRGQGQGQRGGGGCELQQSGNVQGNRRGAGRQSARMPQAGPAAGFQGGRSQPLGGYYGSFPGGQQPKGCEQLQPGQPSGRSRQAQGLTQPKAEVGKGRRAPAKAVQAPPRPGRKALGITAKDKAAQGEAECESCDKEPQPPAAQPVQPKNLNQPSGPNQFYGPGPGGGRGPGFGRGGQLR